MLNIFNIIGSYLFMFIFCITSYYFTKDKIDLYGALFYISICLSFVLAFDTSNEIVIFHKKRDFISNIIIRIIFTSSLIISIIGEINNIEKIQFILYLLITILYSITNLIWLIIHIMFFIKRKEKK